jgi:hypothetical protein
MAQTAVDITVFDHEGAIYLSAKPHSLHHDGKKLNALLQLGLVLDYH